MSGLFVSNQAKFWKIEEQILDSENPFYIDGVSSNQKYITHMIKHKPQKLWWVGNLMRDSL